MKDNEELFEIVSNNDMMCHDGLFSKDGGEDFPLKYIEFPNSVIEDNNDKKMNLWLCFGGVFLYRLLNRENK